MQDANFNLIIVKASEDSLTQQIYLGNACRQNEAVELGEFVQ